MGPLTPTSAAFAAGTAEPAPSSTKKRGKKSRKKGTKKRKKNFGGKSSDASGSYLAPVTNTTGFPELVPANSYIAAGDYRSAINALNALNRPNDANVLNLLGYSHRKLGLVDVGMRYYLSALENNPNHRGVHEYLGEAYLTKDEVGKARTLLKRLGEICGQSCNEYKELAKAISAYEQKHTL